MKSLFLSKTNQKPVKIAKEDFSFELKTPQTPEGYGQLPLDILENESEILIAAPLAGVNIEEAEIVVNENILTVKGKRYVDYAKMGFNPKDAHIQECFWGNFSRSVILPANVDKEKIDASEKNQILYIKIPKKSAINMRIVHIKPRND